MRRAGRDRRWRPTCGNCCAGSLVTPVLVVAALWALYTFNNRVTALDVPPPPPTPAVNARDDFLKAAKMARALVHKSPLSMPIGWQQANTLANFQACAQEAAPILPVLHSGLAKPMQEPSARSFSVNFPEYASYRELARTLGGVAGYYSRVGQPGRAMDVLLDGEEMAVMMPRGGALIADLVAIACESISMHDMEEMLPRLSAADLAHVQARLERIQAKRVSYADIILEEGYSDAASMDRELRKVHSLRDRYNFAKGLVTSPFAAPGTGPTPREYADILKLMLANKRAMLRENLAYYKEVSAECRKPYVRTSAVRVPANPLAQMSILATPGPRSLHVAMEARCEVLRAEVALYRYKADHGGFPLSLDALVPRYLKAVPDDPFGGAPGVPLRYQLRPDGWFLLYSVGPDMRDDNGVPSGANVQAPGDIVAGQLWPKRSGR